MTDPARPGPGLPEEPPERPGTEWGSVVLRLLAALLVLGGAYTAAALYFQDRQPAGMSVDGIQVGSMTRDQAEEHLQDELADRLVEPVRVSVRADGSPASDAEQLELVPQESGLSFDLDATLDGATGLSFDPRVLWAHVTGGGRALTLVGAVDEEALGAAVERAAQDYDAEPVEGEVSLTEEGVEVVAAEPGRTLEVRETAAAVGEAWPDRTDVEGSATLEDPLLTQEEVDRFTAEVVEPALAEPVSVTASRGSGDNETSATAEIAPRELVQLLGVEQDGPTLSLTVDDDAVLARIREDLGQLERGPRDVTVALDGDEVEVVPSRSGTALEEEGLVDAVRAALEATGDERTVEAELTEVPPAVPTSVSEGWVFREMATFESQFPTAAGNEARTANLRAGVEHVNGTVVMPGEQFSLARALGDISVDGGYVEAPIIQDGRLIMGVGGGLSQVSTVVFNASWFAGVQLDEHTPHSFHIARYPAGREATIAIPVIDNLWTNDTDNPVVVRSRIDGDRIVMTFLGERQYDVETIDGEWRDRTEGERVEDDSPECVPQNPAEGFTITNVRRLIQGGAEVYRDEFTTTYIPADEIVCTNPAAGR
ncbi:VanW family protein [Ornithinimicrobium sp. LYQ103]|uniref:VanW family protein n=1 Tax=Ornithinimicrobium sp. LYQ103 TaxID=3378796 RepID=UPI003852B4C0